MFLYSCYTSIKEWIRSIVPLSSDFIHGDLKYKLTALSSLWKLNFSSQGDIKITLFFFTSFSCPVSKLLSFLSWTRTVYHFSSYSTPNWFTQRKSDQITSFLKITQWLLTTIKKKKSNSIQCGRQTQAWSGTRLCLLPYFFIILPLTHFFLKIPASESPVGLFILSRWFLFSLSFGNMLFLCMVHCH